MSNPNPSAYCNPEALISPDALSARMQSDPDRLHILDATYHVPPVPGKAYGEYLTDHIPGAVFFDIDAVSKQFTDPAQALPHMLPSPEDFAETMALMGIHADDLIVAYDRHGIMSAPRVWWMFRIFGHRQVAVLNGGLPAWKAAGLPVEGQVQEQVRETKRNTKKVNTKENTYPTCFHPEWVTDKDTLLKALKENGKYLLLDARSQGRFSGAEPEPRPGLRRGHIPGARNLPWNRLVDPETKHMLPADALRNVFTEVGLFNGKQKIPSVVCSCGSGITACVNALGLYLLGYDDVAVYDGSWAEWGADETLPIETGGAF